jgi:mannose-1-phosphate guanylyltransferase
MHQRSRKEFPSLLGSAGPSVRYAVILAGGDGSRLRPLTKRIAGDERPKQFCPILNDRTLLDETRSRVALKFCNENVYFSLTETHEQYFKNSLWDVRPHNLIVQPENKGTAPAILFSLKRLQKADPNAAVAFFPSDHYFSNDEKFMEMVDKAFSAIDVDPNSVVLLGIEPEKPETSYGWIEPAGSLFGEFANSISRVNRFWEKPDPGAARRLMSKGCLWNSFVMVGKVAAFLAMFDEHLPDMSRMFSAATMAFGRANEPSVIRAVYSWLEETNFSSRVLQRSAERLLVLKVSGVGWSDWGEPQRLLGTLNGLGLRPDWMRAVAA